MLRFDKISKILISTLKNNNLLKTQIRCTQTVPDPVLEKARKSKLGQVVKGASINVDVEKKYERQEADRDYRYIYPDFLPNPAYYYRDKVLERLERRDMFERRKQIIIPEFYVGSILAVTTSDPYAPNKVNRFVGICIKREGYGLRHVFQMRNVVDGFGVEVIYELYNPTIQQIEVLKLEKRLDDDLLYLVDCPPEYSTIPFDFIPIKLPPGSKVPVNDIKVKLNPKPWRHKWERKNLKGAILPELKPSEYQRMKKSYVDFKPYEKYDLMKQYRENIQDDDYAEIVEDIKKFEVDTEDRREKAVGARKIKRTRNLPGQNK